MGRIIKEIVIKYFISKIQDEKNCLKNNPKVF